jgi:hypothetical protein
MPPKESPPPKMAPKFPIELQKGEQVSLDHDLYRVVGGYSSGQWHIRPLNSNKVGNNFQEGDKTAFRSSLRRLLKM